ncbi:MAG: LURP-one-related family protein, partial [Clostridia bacterium]|nr:LURP-one-related family protein [Clostridia bacterium]
QPAPEPETCVQSTLAPEPGHIKLLFKQRIFSWLASYNIFDENGNTVYQIRGKFTFGRLFKIYDAAGNELGTVKKKLFAFKTKFALYIGPDCVGYVWKKRISFKPRFFTDFNGWSMTGNIIEWNYSITDSQGGLVATIKKEIFHLSDTYAIDIVNPADALCAVMLVLAIDAEKADRNNS